MSDLFAEQVRELGDAFNDGDWSEVRRRARRVPRRALLVALAAALAVVVVGSAFAVYRGTVDFFGAAPAPEPIQRDFESLREFQHSPEFRAKIGSPKFTPEGDAREAMRVEIDGEVRSLWVVPTGEGGFCTRLHFKGGCTTPEIKQRLKFSAGGLSAPGDGGGLDWIDGWVSDSAVQEVELLYQDGERVRLPFVWVSAPIDAGFYAYDVPEEHEQSGHFTAALIGRDADGNVVIERCLLLSPDEVEASDAAVVAMCR